MAKAAHMDRLAQRLHDAAATGDWQALAAADQELAALLSRMATPAALATLTPAERTALQSLDQAHRQARGHCTAAGERLAQTMADLQANKDGWLAYALNSDLNESQP